jgi:LPS sulfotransferase NodH
MGVVERGDPRSLDQEGADSGNYTFELEGAPRLGYVIAASPRTGSWLLCHALADSGVAGVPAEYFWQGDERFWRERWAVDGAFRHYVEGFWATATDDGVVGAKLMWAYFFDFLAQARQVPEWAWLDHDRLMEAIFPGTRYLWVSRRDKVRQGISWWRAEATGQWALASCDAAAHGPEELDLAAAKNLVEVARMHDEAWGQYFAERGVEPWHIYYEDLVEDLAGAAASSALRYLGLDGAGPQVVRPRLQRQADELTERWVAEYRAAQDSGRLDDVGPAARVPVVENPGSV